MKKLIRHMRATHPFVRRVGVLVGGTAIGQLIAIMALPVLTRLYEPEAFASLAVYVSTLSLMTVIACLRLEIAIPLPKSHRVAAALLLLSFMSVLCITSLSVIVVVLLTEIVDFIPAGEINAFLWLTPLGVFAVGMYNALQYWCVRHNRYAIVSKTRVTQSLSGTTIKLGVGQFMGGWSTGLILGQIIAQGAGFISLAVSLLSNDRHFFKNIKLIHLKIALKRYQKFPMLATLEAFANAGGVQISIILIVFYVAEPEAGYIFIAMQLLSAPMSLIGRAVSQVYLAEGAERYQKGQLKGFTNNTIVSLAKCSLLPLLILGILSPFATPYLLGDEWARVGILISWMVPWFFMQFITSPVSMVLHITGNQAYAVKLQVFGLVVRCGAVVAAARYEERFVSEAFSLSGFLFYSIYLFVVLHVVRRAG